MPTVTPRATIDDVAALAEVSIKTVSRVINREPNVRETTRKRVEAAIQKLNYRPNLAARNLASLRSHLIALVYDDPSVYELSSPGYIISMQEGALRACRAANHELLIHPCNYHNDDVRQELQSLIGQTRPDGIVLAAPLSNMPRLVDAITETNTALVCLSPGSKASKQPAIATDDRAVCAEMTLYLAELGHKHIAFIKGDSNHLAVANRFLGFKDGLAQAGRPLSKELIVAGDNSIGSGEACAEKLLALKKRPTAIFAANDDMAAGVVRVAHRLGLKVPADLSVAGFDDSPLAQQIYPALTSIRQPLSAMAELAAKKLIHNDAINAEVIELLPSTIVKRDSTGPAPAQGLKRILSK